jgi:NADH-quinone oxidoreductase subunit F
VRVCCGTGCRANGALALAQELERALAGEEGGRLGARVKRTGCHGFCERGRWW